jgi:ribose transport system ATP-binding protein
MERIRKRFGATVALDGVDLEVGAGEVLALVGENGAGKSTLMKVLSGVHKPDEGSMTLFGQPFAPADPHDSRRAGVSMIYQELSLAPDLTVAENILVGKEPLRQGLIDWRTLREEAAVALRAVGREDIPLDARVGSLPIAIQQLIEIARGVAAGGKVLVLDEPTSSLSQADCEHLFDLVDNLRRQGYAIIYISHFLEEVRRLSDRYVVIRDGKTVGAGRTADVTQAEMVALMVGRDVEDLYPRSQRTRGEAILSIAGLGGRTMPVRASLTLYRGEVLGIAGVVGAGRTELLRSLFGLDPVRSGEITVRSQSDQGAVPARRWQAGIGLVSEDRKREGLAVNLSIADNLTLTRLQPWVKPSEQRKHADHWGERLKIRRRHSDQPVGDLSGGNQQKVALARLLHHGAEVLLLDEPTRGIDVGSKAQIYATIDELASEGKAILMVSSYLPELLGVCDRIAVMCRGVLGEARPVHEWDERSIMREATGAVVL